MCPCPLHGNSCSLFFSSNHLLNEPFTDRFVSHLLPSGPIALSPSRVCGRLCLSCLSSALFVVASLSPEQHSDRGLPRSGSSSRGALMRGPALFFLQTAPPTPAPVPLVSPQPLHCSFRFPSTSSVSPLPSQCPFSSLCPQAPWVAVLRDHHSLREAVSLW